MGGFPGGAGGRKAGPTGDADNKRYYRILECSENASPEELKKSHRRLALRHHPDKGGDPEKFKEINEAYDVLKDEEKRELYDRFGEQALKEGVASAGGGAGGMDDIFDMFMGMGGGGGRKRGPPKSPDVMHTFNVTLLELYTGSTKKLSLQRNVKCPTCKGAGSKSGKTYECGACKGTGVQTKMRPIGPGMMQQTQVTCPACGGSGFNKPPVDDTCGTCSGKRLVPEKKTIDVVIEPGMDNGSRIRLRGEAGTKDPSAEHGDIIVSIKQMVDSRFQRVGCDLMTRHYLTLQQALCGTALDIQHIDGRVLRVRVPKGRVVQPETFTCVRGEGMPVHGSPFEKGNLYVRLSVKFPTSLSDAQIQTLAPALQAAFPASIPSTQSAPEPLPDNHPNVYDVGTRAEEIEDIESEMSARKHSQARSNAQKSRGAVDDDDDDGISMGGGPQHVQCAQS